MDITKFIISDTQYLKVIPKSISIDKDDCEVCAIVNVDYIDEPNNICIRFGNGSIQDFCYKIAEYDLIQKLINGEMSLNNSIIKDLGIECNQFFTGKQKINGFMSYFFLSNDHAKIRPYYNSWLYNDKDGNIIFEITPFYPYLYETKRSHPDFITYKQFMKDYKPTIKTIIPKKNIKKWINQAKKLKKMLIDEPAAS